MDDIVPSAPSIPFPLRLLRWVLPVMMGVVFLAGLGGGIRLAFSLGQPFPGFALMWRKELKLYSVGLSTPSNWPGLSAGMEINDRILCLEGYLPNPDSVVYGLDPRYADFPCPNGAKKYAHLYRERFNSGDPSLDLLIDRAGQIMTIPDVPLVRFNLTMLAETFLPSFLLGLGLLTVGTTVYHASPTSELNLIFTLFTTIIAGLIMDQSYTVIVSDRWEDARIAALLLTVPWMPLLGAAFFHLTGLLADQGPWPQLTRWLHKPYYGLSLLFSLLGIFVYIMVDQPISIPLDWPFGYFIAGSTIFAGVWGLISLTWAWLRASSRRIRHQTGLILLAVAITIVFMSPYLLFLFTNAPTFRFSHSIPYLGLSFVAIIAYTILRYQLFVSKARILTALLVVTWCVLAANLVYLLLGQNMGFLPILAVALVTSIGLEARRGPTSFFNQLLRRETLDYQTVARFSRRVGELQTIESLLVAAQESFQENLDVAHLDVWLLDGEHQTMERFCNGQPAGAVPIPSNCAKQLIVQPDPVHIDRSSRDYQVLLDKLGPGHIVVWAPLVEREQAVGLLGLGPRWTGEVYGEQDLELIGILARQMALAILNTRQFERLQATSRLIQQAEENERFKMARELHDTVLQFLLVLTYGLDDLKEPQERLADEINNWQERISAEASRLRDMLSYLRAPEVLVQQGLITSLQSWLGQVRSSTEICIEAHLSPAAEEALSVDAQVTVYRVFREAINNALKYSQGSHITAWLQREGEQVRFCIEDDGQGFDVASALAGGGKGYSSLQDMRTYVENVGGALDIRSALGKGTIIDGQVPVKAIAVTG